MDHVFKDSISAEDEGKRRAIENDLLARGSEAGRVDARTFRSRV